MALVGRLVEFRALESRRVGRGVQRTVCRIVQDRDGAGWFVEGVYD
jgi:hypothetical protein